MFSFSKGPFLGSMSIFWVVLFLTSTSVVLLKCHVKSIVINLLSKKSFWLSKKWDRVALYRTEKNEIQTFPTFLFWMSWTVLFAFQGEDDFDVHGQWCLDQQLLGGSRTGRLPLYLKRVQGNVAEMLHHFQEIFLARDILKSTKETAQKGFTTPCWNDIVFFLKFPQLQWKSMRIIPNPKPNFFKRKGGEGGLHRLHPPPPILWFGINPGKKNWKKINVSTSRNIDTKQITSRCPTVSVVRNPKGFWLNIQVEDAGV